MSTSRCPRLALLLLSAAVVACDRAKPAPAPKASATLVAAPVATTPVASCSPHAGTNLDPNPGRASEPPYMSVMISDATLEAVDAAGRRAGVVSGCGARHDIPGSWSESESITDDVDSTAAPGPVIMTVGLRAQDGDRYLVEVTPDSSRADSLHVSFVSADQTTNSTRFVPFKGVARQRIFLLVVIDSGVARLSPPIAGVEVVPSCTTAHEIRNGSTADLDVSWLVSETGERGALHLPARATTERYRAVQLTTATPGSVSVSLMQEELAHAGKPASCP